MKAAFFFFFFFSVSLFGNSSVAQSSELPIVNRILVSLLQGEAPKSIVFKPQSGGFRVFSGDKKLYELKNGESLFITISSEKVRARTISRAIGTFKTIAVKSPNDSALFTLQSVKPSVKPRVYSGNISFSSSSASVKSVLDIDFENYVAGVVEAEIGVNQVSEMYKVQSIIVRTYALENLKKHQHQQFNLCDGVHCQSFKGVVASGSTIAEACDATRDLIVVDSDDEIITAVFHANCGGQTVNSEDVWPRAKPYLRSTVCPYCADSKNYTWRKGISVGDWTKYVNRYNANLQEGIPENFKQSNRMVNVRIGNHDVALHRVRQDLGFRSAFFSFSQMGDSVIFTGRGYGHGVGLCQDGAANMARQNMTYEQIIAFYYQGCKVLNIHNAHPEQPEDHFFDDYSSENYGLTQANKKDEPIDSDSSL